MKSRIKGLVMVVLCWFAFSCEYEPYENKGQLIYKGTELYDMLDVVFREQSEATCVEFVYPFVINVYDASEELLSQNDIFNDSDFSELLETLTEGQSISLSFPITKILEDGSVFSINSNEELKAAIDACYQECVIGECEYFFCDPEAIIPFVWTVLFQDNQDNTYASSHFLVNSLGELTFHYNGTITHGNWVFLYIESDLYVNIHLEGDSELAEFWNHNMEVTSYTEQNFVFEHPVSGKKVHLFKSLEYQTEYTIGSTGQQGIVFYDKGFYHNGWRYMEVLPTSLNALQWGCSNTSVIGASSSAIGSGYYNSCKIANFHDSLGGYYSNPQQCAEANDGTVAAKEALLQSNLAGNWFVPTEDELRVVYENLYLGGFGNITPTRFWTSTQLSNSEAMTIDFETGNAIPTEKSANYNVLLVRYF
jgi:hypothetical protein